jgi:hypothetical protein
MPQSAGITLLLVCGPRGNCQTGDQITPDPVDFPRGARQLDVILTDRRALRNTSSQIGGNINQTSPFTYIIHQLDRAIRQSYLSRVSCLIVCHCWLLCLSNIICMSRIVAGILCLMFPSFWLSRRKGLTLLRRRRIRVRRDGKSRIRLLRMRL